MAVCKTIEQYLDAVEEQIRWKRARPVLLLELRHHLEDQRDAFAAEGFEDAEKMAVEEMGDPVPVGAELDMLHRPNPQRGLLALTALLALAGGFLRVWLTVGSDANFRSGKTMLALVLGTAALLIGYWGDWSFLLRRPKTVYIAALAAGVLLWRISPLRNNIPYLASYVVQLYPPVFALWLYNWRGKGWPGLLASAAGGIPLALICTIIPCLSNTLILLLSGFVLLLFAIWQDWFHLSKPLATAVLTFPAAAFVSGVFLWDRFSSYFSSRMQAFLYPEQYASTIGYQGTAVRQALNAAQWFGKGMAEFAPYPFEQYVPEWNRDFLLTTVIYKLGWLPFFLVVLAMAILLVWILLRWSSSTAGQILVLSVVMVFVCRTVFSVLMNLGFVLSSFGFPLLTGNLQSIVDMALIGLALSVFRNGSILRENNPIRQKAIKNIT